MRKRYASTGLTELEGQVLSVLWGKQPTTTYQIRRAFARSPTNDLALSQGSIYPVIDRLKKKGLVRATTLAGARKAENLTCTPTGVEAVKRWVCDMTAKLPDDPLRSRVLSLSVLSHAERSQWVNTARAAVLSQLAQVDEFAEANPGAVFELAHDNARSSLLARLRWLDRVETKIGTLIFR